jgi:DNA-binding MarR family transcriptional regulator
MYTRRPPAFPPCQKADIEDRSVCADGPGSWTPGAASYGRTPSSIRSWSERQAQAAGLTPAQHQLLLAIRGHPDPCGPTLGDVAAYLLLRHHSAVGLVDRAEAAGLLIRRQDPDNLSIVRLRLTDVGSRQLEALSELHLEELAHLAPTMQALWEALEHDSDGGPRHTPHPAAPPPEATAPPPLHSPRRRRRTEPIPLDRET